MPIAKSVQDVILGEAAYTGISDVTYADMMGIASVINNRQIALGVPAQDVVSAPGQFDAYGNRLPAGVNAYREMAEKAWNDVLTNGSITDATFYSTPAATQNLPSGLEQKAAVPGGHVYFSDPYERAIRTAVGYRQPVDIAAVRAQVEQRLATDEEFGGSIPTPASAPEQGEEAVADAAGPSLDGSNVDAAGARMGEPTVAIDPGRTAPLERAMPVIDAEMAMSVADKIAEATAAQKSDRLAGNVVQTADPGRFADPSTSNPVVGKDALANALSGDMATGLAAQRDYVTPTPNMAALNIPEGLDPSFNEALMAASNPVVPTSVETTSYPDNALSTPATAEVAASRFATPEKTSRFSTVAINPERMAPTPAVETSDVADDPNAALSSNLMSPTSLENVQAPAKEFAPTDTTVLGPEAGLNVVDNRFVAPDVSQPTGIDSAEQQQMIADVERQLANPSITAPDPNAALDAAQTKTPTVEGWSAMAAANPITAAIDANVALSTPADVASMTTDITAPSPVDTRTEVEAAADFAQEVGAQKKDRITPQDQVRMETQIQAPALETVEIAEQPTIAAPVDDPNTVLSAPTVSAPALTEPAVTETLTQPASNPMQSAADRTLGTAMGVWNGQVQTGIATDGSTVSRLADGSVARYNPKFDQTEYTDDEGATWGGLVAGNKIPTSIAPAADPNSALSTPSSNPFSGVVSAISPGGLLGGGILGKIVGLLSGLGSPTGVATAGTDGGARVADHGPAGAPGGSGPGGTGSSAGGYGSTHGKDPNGTY